MVKARNTYNNIERLRGYSSVFSSTSFFKLLKDNDYTFIDTKIERYDTANIGKEFITYADYIKYIYKQLLKEYRNEYVYKNTLINELLLKKYGTKNTVAFNEFKAGKSVADFVLFNGISKVFEIKTELDTEKRLEKQLADYTKIFKECYIVTYESLVDKYMSVNENTGIISVRKSRGSLKIVEVRKAKENIEIDASILMRSLRTSEYKNIILAYYGSLPKDINSFNMYNKCYNLMLNIPHNVLHSLFLHELKSRKTNTILLPSFLKELRQLCLSMNINSFQYNDLNTKLNQPIVVL